MLNHKIRFSFLSYNIFTDCYGLRLEGLMTTLRTEAVTALASLTPHVSLGDVDSQLRPRVVTCETCDGARLAAGQSDKLLRQPPTPDCSETCRLYIFKCDDVCGHVVNSQNVIQPPCNTKEIDHFRAI